ncbi:MAG: hypothetical protein A2020_13150 [Lentisphaerae bacterium GWF2_45_14]|nr:MAG: hypothetical protein A2020_13150 [Lentisphaerae bacterium GWF2_45_14]
MKLSLYGAREWLGCGVAALVLIAITLYLAFTFKYYVTGWICSGFVVFLWLCVAAFFRDPPREIPKQLDILVSPADGVVRDIGSVECPEIKCFENGSARRIGIFLSVLNVHLNRAPCRMRVEYEQYKKGKFHDARNTKASKENESMTIGGIADMNGYNFPVAVKQISGAIARRIVCPVRIGQVLEKGKIFGMIKFGSRTELYLPDSDDFEILVKEGDKVYAGSTPIARFKLAPNDEDTGNPEQTTK